MPIINRELSASQQRDTFPVNLGALATGVTALVGCVPFPCSLDALQVFAMGTSGSPTVNVYVHRFIAGVGYTNFSLGGAQAVPNFGTSGVLSSGYTLPAMGSTLVTLQANDLLMVLTGGTNSAVSGLNITPVLRPIQDITQYFGGVV